MQFPAIWEFYKKHEASFWTAEEIDLAQDNKEITIRATKTVTGRAWEDWRLMGFLHTVDLLDGLIDMNLGLSGIS